MITTTATTAGGDTFPCQVFSSDIRARQYAQRLLGRGGPYGLITYVTIFDVALDKCSTVCHNDSELERGEQ